MELTQLNQRLTLQLAILAEQKAAKTIELLERLRKDHPAIPDHHDEEASAMAQPTSPEAVLNAIKSESA
jgi:head-tail adaptor